MERKASVSSASAQQPRARSSASTSLPGRGPVNVAGPAGAVPLGAMRSYTSISAAPSPGSGAATGPTQGRRAAPSSAARSAVARIILGPRYLPAPAIARSAPGCGQARKRSSQSAAPPMVPGLASARGADGTTSGGARLRKRCCTPGSPLVNWSLRNWRTGELVSAISRVSARMRDGCAVLKITSGGG
jgi:hypothetical protein